MREEAMRRFLTRNLCLELLVVFVAILMVLGVR